ncbi:hypothetical protein [Barnesiella viscericola]|uniref:hypothetical protein n=1 Tax=Barnesiella viscericola TaxID=397865 RepID=UPI00320969D9
MPANKSRWLQGAKPATTGFSVDLCRVKLPVGKPFQVQGIEDRNPVFISGEVRGGLNEFVCGCAVVADK